MYIVCEQDILVISQDIRFKHCKAMVFSHGKRVQNGLKQIVTCAADSYVPRAENVIRFVRERLSAIQSETLFKKYPKRLTIEMVKRVTVLINSFRRKSGVHPVLSPRQILSGKKFKTPLCKIGELVMAYNIKASKNTLRSIAIYALCIGPNNSSTSHSVFKLSTKQLLINRN